VPTTGSSGCGSPCAAISLTTTVCSASGRATAVICRRRDEWSRWVVRRWERDQEDSASVGPIVTHNKVWVAKDVETAKAIFREEENKQRQFPEKINPADGLYEFEGKVVGLPYEELSMLSACVRDRCDDPGRKDRHHRLLARKGSAVMLLYLYGREHATKPELVVYFLGKNLERV
jgi:hypothetical protein